MVERRRSADIVVQQSAQLVLKVFICPSRVVGRGELIERTGQRLGDKPAAVIAKPPTGGRNVRRGRDCRRLRHVRIHRQARVQMMSITDFKVALASSDKNALACISTFSSRLPKRTFFTSPIAI